MNVYLRLLVKPHKKEKLLVSNNVLKLASKLLKVKASSFCLVHPVLSAVSDRSRPLRDVPSGESHMFR